MKHLFHSLACATLLWVAATTVAAQVPTAGAAGKPEHHVFEAPSDDALRAADEERVLRGEVPHYAVAHEVKISPWHEDHWRLVGGRAHWRARITSPGAHSLNLAFGRYAMPAQGKMTLRSVDGKHRLRPFTDADNETHGQLWTPPIPTDDLWIDLSLPVEALHELDLELNLVHHGYAGFGAPPPKVGDCHVDIACSEAVGWGDVARSVALVSIDGVRFCTGFLVNNTALDGRPFFLTADHCGIDRANAPSVVVMWKHERPACDLAASNPSAMGTFQTGAIWRAAHRGSDTVLLELDDPPPARAAVYYAGWDRSPEPPDQPVTIHHPNTDAKRISFDFDAAVVSSHLARGENLRAQHLRIDAWDLGSTEGGSSGAPLLNRDKRVVGQLHGGYAACGVSQPDWFGRFSSAWRGRGRPGERLSDWLDPIGSEPMVLDGLDGLNTPSSR